MTGHIHIHGHVDALSDICSSAVPRDEARRHGFVQSWRDGLQLSEGSRKLHTVTVVVDRFLRSRQSRIPEVKGRGV